jgi:hypothetical protein
MGELRRWLAKTGEYRALMVTVLAVVMLLAVDVIGCTTRSDKLLALEITSPKNKAELTDSSVVVTGIVSPPTASVTINNEKVKVEKDGSFSSTVSLSYGENVITVGATTNGKEMTTKAITVSRILTLKVDSPQDKAEVAESRVIVSGVVSDPTAIVTVNGQAARVGSDGAFNATVELNYVKNTILVRAQVNGQLPVTRTLDITRILILEIDSPPSLVETTDGSIAVSGKVYPPSAKVTLNGTEIETAKDGSFTTEVELQYGENSLVVNAIDPVTRTISVVRLLTMEIDSPKDGKETNESQVTVAGTVSDPAVSITVNGEAASVAENGTFSVDTPLKYGDNVINVVAALDGKQIAAKQVTVTRVLALELTAPLAREATESPLTVSGKVSDPAAHLTVNGQEVPVDGDGSFATLVELQKGENSIVVVASVEGDGTVTRTANVSFTPIS